MMMDQSGDETQEGCDMCIVPAATTTTVEADSLTTQLTRVGTVEQWRELDRLG